MILKGKYGVLVLALVAVVALAASACGSSEEAAAPSAPAAAAAAAPAAAGGGSAAAAAAPAAPSAPAAAAPARRRKPGGTFVGQGDVSCVSLVWPSHQATIGCHLFLNNELWTTSWMIVRTGKSAFRVRSRIASMSSRSANWISPPVE